jgi:hypothetical protein
MPYLPGDNGFGVTKWVVNPTKGLGTHQTLAAAMTSASSGDTITMMPGTYTENGTFKVGVNINAALCDAQTPNVKIVGKWTISDAGTVSISGICFQTNSDFCLVNSGSAASILNLNNCFIKASNNNAISFTSSSSSAEINLNYCLGSLDTTGIAYFAHSSAGSTRLRHCNMRNPGGSITASTFSAGTLDIVWTQFSNPITSSSTASMGGYFSNFQFSSLNVTALTAGGSGNHEFRFCSFISDTASAVSISASCNLYNCVIYSTNTNAITGAGTLNSCNLTFTGSSSTINTTTQTATYANLGKYQATKQPAFLANLSASANNVTGDGTTYVIVFDVERFDQGSNFDTTTGIFTAPITGRYQISFVVALGQLGVANTDMDVQINSSNLTNIQAFRINPTAIVQATENSFPGSLLIDMDAADTVKIQVTVSGGTKIVDVVGTTGGGSFFSGYLAC